MHDGKSCVLAVDLSMLPSAQAAFSAFRMLAGGGKGFASGRAPAQQPITAAEAAAAEAQAQHRQAWLPHVRGLACHRTAEVYTLWLAAEVNYIGRCICRDEKTRIDAARLHSALSGVITVQEEEEKRRLEAELREFDSRLERSERSKNTTY